MYASFLIQSADNSFKCKICIWSSFYKIMHGKLFVLSTGTITRQAPIRWSSYVHNTMAVCIIFQNMIEGGMLFKIDACSHTSHCQCKKVQNAHAMWTESCILGLELECLDFPTIIYSVPQKSFTENTFVNLGPKQETQLSLVSSLFSFLSSLSSLGHTNWILGK